MEVYYLMMKNLQKHSVKNESLTENNSIKEPSVDLFTDAAKLASDKNKKFIQV